MSKLPTGRFDKARKQEVSKPQLFPIHEGSVKSDFEKLHEDGKSLLTTDSKYIVFCGLLELTDRACVHMELKNPTKKTILFNIRTPASPVFFVKPHVGMIDAGKKVTLYFTFRGHCHRVPSDYCWLYSIYQIEIDQSSREWIMQDEFQTTNLRSVWNEKGRGRDISNILHLSCRFDEKEKATTDCKKHKIERNLFLNEVGDVVNAGTYEESREVITTPNTPQMRPGSRPRSRPGIGSKKPSAESDELPKTAESTRGGIKV